MFERSLALEYSWTVLSLVFASTSPWGVILPMYSPVTFTGHFLPGTRLLVALVEVIAVFDFFYFN